MDRRCGTRPLSAYASRESFGAPDWEVPGRVTSYLAIRDASLERITDAMRELTGRHPSSLDGYLRARPESLEHVTGEGA
jgi:NAD(P)H dehydrogenase (quinone)